MSPVDVWFFQAVARTYEPWTDNRVIPPAERQLARERVAGIRWQLSQLDTQAMPAVPAIH